MSETLATYFKKMNHPTEESFLQDVKDHVMTVKHDQGVYRHLVFQNPESSNQHFHIVTYPGYLCYSGDMGSYVFTRVEDMFRFFRKHPNDKHQVPINLYYWAQKVEAVDRCDGLKKYSKEKLEEYVRDSLIDDSLECKKCEWNEEGTKRLKQCRACKTMEHRAESEIIDNAEDEISARQALDDFQEDEGYDFGDPSDWDLQDYTYRFVWACYAIAWGIQQYDASKQS